MDICLTKATLDDAETIHVMQIESFMALFEKYQDFETSPANESIEKTVMRINQEFTDYYIIKKDNVLVGSIRIVKKDNELYRVSPISILSEYQGYGIAQKTFKIIEELYNDAKAWELDTILQEPRNCYLYEKLGYVKTGNTKIINDKMTLVFYEKYIKS